MEPDYWNNWQLEQLAKNYVLWLAGAIVQDLKWNMFPMFPEILCKKVAAVWSLDIIQAKISALELRSFS